MLRKKHKEEVGISCKAPIMVKIKRDNKPPLFFLIWMIPQECDKKCHGNVFALLWERSGFYVWEVWGREVPPVWTQCPLETCLYVLGDFGFCPIKGVIWFSVLTPLGDPK